jgi:DNA repair exonuclease SbcCD ATPase subunit
VAKVNSAGHENSKQAAGESLGQTLGADDIVLQVMTVAEESGALTDECRELLWQVLTGIGERPLDDTAAPEAKLSQKIKKPAGAYLKSITVAGFRGIGPEARLDLHPAPGVVVVAGRNGSGKSTFSEAVEVALTRTSYRWEAKKGASDWRAGWRNLHVDDPCHIRIELAEEGIGTTTVAADLGTATKEPRDGVFWAQRPGKPRDRSADPLGWAKPLELHRPLLSYDELGGILESRPSELYEKLSTILGLGRIADAQDRLDELVKSLTAPRREARALITNARDALAASADPRAVEASKLLSARSPDIEALARLATGAFEPLSGDMAILRELAALAVPTVEQFRDAITGCETAQHTLAELSSDATQALVNRTGLLKHAVAHVEAAGTQKCPLCGVGTLDAAWVASARREISELDQRVESLRNARRAYEESIRRLASLLPPIPGALGAEMDEDVEGRAKVAEAWQAANSIDAASKEGPRLLLAAIDSLVPLVVELKTAADAERLRREEVWTPLARQVAAVANALEKADEADRQAVTAKATQSWLKDHANELRNERLRPIADQAREIWAALRQESNVDLGEIELEGAKTRRRVTVTASVDGKEAGALTVMSQGELHALALALFLPRATIEASPFRFVLIDDPVQAMDPAKVDGLARVLDRIGQTRQVIVFTHDDRLPEAVRRLGIEARILLVNRMQGSRVEVVTESDPAERYLQDAFAVARDPRADDVLRRRAIPVLCRMAVENACKDVFMARRHGRGEGRDAIEREWQDAHSTRHRVALALQDSPRADVERWLSSRPARHTAMTVVGRAAHEGLVRNPVAAVRDVETLVRDIRADAP